MSDLTVEDVDFLLKRDWFLSEDDIDQLFWSVSEDVFWEVATRYNEYPLRVREVIRLYYIPNYTPLADKLKYKIVDE